LSVWFLRGPKGKKSVYIEFESEEAASNAITQGTLNYQDEEKEFPLQIKSKVNHMKIEEEQKSKNNNRKRKHEEEVVYDPGKLLKITNINEISNDDEDIKQLRDFMKAAMAEYGNVYIDDSSKESYILRFADPEAAKKALKALTEDKKQIRDKTLNASILEGEEEKTYWEINEQKKQSRFKKRKFNNNNNKKRKKKR